MDGSGSINSIVGNIKTVSWKSKDNLTPIIMFKKVIFFKNYHNNSTYCTENNKTFFYYFKIII